MSIKSFSKSTFIYSIGTIALRFTTFLLIPLYTHYLTQAEFGLLQTLLLTIQVIITINDFGLRSALMRFFAEYEKKSKLRELLGSSFSINVLVGIILIFISLLIPDSFISSFFKTELIPNVIIFTFIVGVGQTLSLNILSYFRAKDQGLIYMIISLATSLVLILLTYVFLVEFSFGLIGILWAQSITFFSMWLFVLIWITIQNGLRIEKKLTLTLLKFGFPLIFAMSGDMIINTSGSYLLGHFNNLEDVAIFSLAYKIASIGIMVLIGPFQMAYEPYVFRNKENPELSKIISQISTYIILSFIIVSWGILFVFRDLIKIMGPNEYNNAYYFVFLILPGLGSTIFNYIGQSLLHINNKTKITGMIILTSTIISLIISFVFIKYLGLIGLIISINIYLFLSSFLLFFFGIREFPIKLNFQKIYITILIGIFLFIGTYYLSSYNNLIYYSGSLGLMGGTMLVLIKSKFFTDSEKEKFGNLIRKLKFN